MGNSEWDKYLRELLNDFEPEGPIPPWDEFAHHLDPSTPPSSDPVLPEDEILRENLSAYKPDVEVEGWDRIESSLDAANRQFDEEVRKHIQRFEPQYDPLSWPIFLKRFTASKLLRAKLIALKGVEFAAVILLLLTVVNMGQMGKLPFESPLPQENPAHQPSATHPQDRAYHSEPSLNSGSGSVADAKDIIKFQENELAEFTLNGTSDYSRPTSPAPQINTATAPLDRLVMSEITSLNQTSLSSGQHAILSGKRPDSEGLAMVMEANSLDDVFVSEPIASLQPALMWSDKKGIPGPKYVRPVSGTFFEFGILTQTDYNRLRMPEDRFFSSGKQIVFPQQGIPSQGYGAGFTVAIGHPLWSLETGIIYSAKSFKPGRHLLVGGANENGSVEFEAMRLQLISVPIQYRYRFVPQGRLKAYGLAGLGLHVIAQSDIDVTIKYYFPNLSYGKNPNDEPTLANILRNTRHIREHFLDKGPISSKTFVTANAGLGIEYGVTPQKTLFLQTALQYQIPNLKFSNNSGKHIRSISLQAGVRTPLGT